jgi:transcription antitermination factor NusG
MVDQTKIDSEELNQGLRRQWFAVQVKARCEKLVATVLQHKGFEQFFPSYQSRHRWSDRLRTVEVPLFPGYVFCRLDPQYRLPVLVTPGVVKFVGIGRFPVPIDDAEIASIQSAVQSGLRTEPWPFLDVGQRVQVEDGPLTGLEGILVEVRKLHRVVLSVTLLRRSVAVEVERQWVRPLNPGRYNRSIRRDAHIS